MCRLLFTLGCESLYSLSLSKARPATTLQQYEIGTTLALMIEPTLKTISPIIESYVD
jgi:hypothetical protein